MRFDLVLLEMMRNLVLVLHLKKIELKKNLRLAVSMLRIAAIVLACFAKVASYLLSWVAWVPLGPLPLGPLPLAYLVLVGLGLASRLSRARMCTKKPGHGLANPHNQHSSLPKSMLMMETLPKITTKLRDHLLARLGLGPSRLSV